MAGAAVEDPSENSGVQAAEIRAQALERARWWERHVLEVTTGHDPAAPRGSESNPLFDPQASSLAAREAAKAKQLSELSGRAVSAATVKRMRLRYAHEGLAGLVDGRSSRASSAYGRNDPRIVEALRKVIASCEGSSLPAHSQLARLVREQLDSSWGAGAVRMPSQATFNRLIRVVDAGGSPTETGPSTAVKRPTKPAAALAGVIGIDTINLDVDALDEAGGTRRVAMTLAVDTATFSLGVALVHPAGLATFDLAPVVRRLLTAQADSPGANPGSGKNRSIDGHGEGDPGGRGLIPTVIETTAAYGAISDHVLVLCQNLGISVVTRSAGRKSATERLAEEIASKFTEFVSTLMNPILTSHPANERTTASVSFAGLQYLLDAWKDRIWQQTPHPALLDPSTPGKTLAPSEAGFRRVLAQGLSPGPAKSDLIGFLPMRWCTATRFGVRLNGLTYSSAALHPLSLPSSSAQGAAGHVEVRFDPFDAYHVWVRAAPGEFLRLTRAGVSHATQEERLQLRGKLRRQGLWTEQHDDVDAAISDSSSSSEGRHMILASDRPRIVRGQNIIGSDRQREERIAHHTRLGPWPTRLIESMRFCIDHAAASRINHPGSPRKLIMITGEPGTGKTTAALEAAKLYAGSTSRHVSPVVYFSLPTQATPRAFIQTLAHTHGIEVPRRRSAFDAIDAVCQTLRERGCDLLLFDDVHHANDETVSLMRRLSEHLPAAMVVAGVNLVRTSFRSWTREQRLEPQRYTLISAQDFSDMTPEDRFEWFALIGAVERSLYLNSHQPGSLTALSDYLFERTHGNISALSRLIAGAAHKAIESGTESISRDILDSIMLDMRHQVTPHREPSGH